VITYVLLWWYHTEFFLEWEMIQTKLLETIRTRILCSITFSRKSCCLWDKVEKYDKARQATGDNIIRRMRIACWLTKTTNTHSEYVIFFCFFRAKIVAQMHLIVTLYFLCPSCCHSCAKVTWLLLLWYATTCLAEVTSSISTLILLNFFVIRSLKLSPCWNIL
jgi:hypothetical protein